LPVPNNNEKVAQGGHASVICTRVHPHQRQKKKWDN